MKNKNVDSAQDALSLKEIDQLVLSEYPYLIAVNYRRMLQADSWQQKTRECIGVFESSMRAITLGILSQYLIRDRDNISDSELNRELSKKKLTNISLGLWVHYLFLALKAYKGKRELFFMHELYDLYWDASQSSEQPRKGVRGAFDKLVEIRNVIVHKTVPKDEIGWENLGKDAMGNLREVMKQFSFLQNYDLIRIVSLQGKEYEYEQFTGQDVVHRQEILKSEEKIQLGWFYLSRQDNTLLRLHPLLIFWNSDDGNKWLDNTNEDGQDIAMFDWLLKDTAGYIAAVVRKVIKENDAILLSELRDLISYNLERIKMAPQRVKLSWAAIRDIAGEVSSEQMEGAKTKYNAGLYLQRMIIFNKFDKFLSSDKGCFVLTGKSGVGKSNYILSLAETFAEQPETIVLMYNAARLDFSSITVMEKINQDLHRSIQLQGDGRTNLFAEIEKSEDMTGRKMIVIFDAINENTNPRDILQKIDQMVGQERYSWLKILITSRPEGWRTMKRGLPLAYECYYREQGSDDVSIEMEEFTTVKLDLFDREELQFAYEKYRSFFNLQTEYTALKSTVRNALGDPLVLRLVAEIYKNKSIPDHIQVNDIYNRYVDSLLGSGRLQRQDVILLEQELMPLMLKLGFYENKLTASQIQTAKTRDGRSLWELIHNADPIGGEQRVNDSYTRLRDTELLYESGTGLDYAISFKYERFYEFFGGRRLYQAEESMNKSDFYSDVAEHLNMKIFLWGALVQALILELKDGNVSLLEILAGKTTDNRLLRSALVETLVRFGEGNKERAREFIERLLGQLTPPPRNFFVELWQLFRPVRKETLQDQPQKMIVVEVAARLGMTDLLEELATEPSPWLRNLAVQNIFYLWKRDRHAGLKILDRLSYRVRGKYGLPHLGTVESMLALTGAILGVEHKDPATLENLLSIGRNALRRILYLTDLNKELIWTMRIRKFWTGLLYNLITGAILKFVLRTMGEWGKHTWASTKGMEHFFTLPAEQKQKVRTMIPFLDYDEPGLENRINEMIEIHETGDQISQIVLGLSIFGHGVKDFDGTLKIVQQMIVIGLRRSPPPFWINIPVDLVQSAARLENPNPELMELLGRVVTAIHNDSASWVEQARQERPTPVSSDIRAACISPYLVANYIFTNRIEVPELIQGFLNQAIDENDEEYLRDYIQELVGMFELGYYRSMIAGLKTLSNYKSEGVHQAIIKFLIRARIYEPEYIEDMLLRGDFPPEIADRVLANPSTEHLTDLLTWQLATIIYDLFILGPQTLRNELKWLFTKALDLSNFEEFIILVIREILNIVIGEVVFNVPTDAPSRQYQLGN